MRICKLDWRLDSKPDDKHHEPDAVYEKLLKTQKTPADHRQAAIRSTICEPP